MIFFSYLLAFLVLSIIIFVHELGHFLVARITGITVEIFSIGFGPEMIGFTRGNTRYRLSWIPFGGYCKLKGELEDTSPHSLYGKPHWIRIFVLLAGPFANLMFALLMMIILYQVGYQEIVPSRRVDVVESLHGKTSPAWLAGIRPESEIIMIHGAPVTSYQDIVEKVSLHANQSLQITYILGKKTNTTTVIPILSPTTGIGDIGVIPLYEPVIGGILSNTPAATIGLQKGDRIIAINDNLIQYYYQFREMIKEKANQRVTLKVVRQTQTNTFYVTLDRFEGRGFLGITISGKSDVITNYIKSKNLFAAIQMGSQDLLNQLVLTFQGFGRMVQGNIGISQNLYGPIRIVRDTALITQWMDFSLLARFIAIISLGLAIANLLPIPGLDGGHILINTLEWISRRKMPDTLRIAIENIGVLLLLILAAWVLSNDVSNIFRGK